MRSRSSANGISCALSASAPTACCCSTSTMSTLAASTTVSIRSTTSTAYRPNACSRCILPATRIMAATSSTPTLTRCPIREGNGKRMHLPVHTHAQVSAEERLAIYANAYRLRLLEALGTDYPGLHTVLGDDEFDAMGRAYIAAHPSPYFSLRWFGDRMSESLRTTAPYEKYPVFTEMAAFQWAQSDAFDAAHSAVASINDLAAIPHA